MKTNILVIMFMAFIVALFYFALVGFPTMQCQEKAEMQGYGYKWDLFTGCMINVDGKWMDYEKWRLMK